MSARELLILLLVSLVWGFHFIVVKVATAEIPPIFYAAVRMSLVAAVTAPFLRWRRGEMSKLLGAGLCLGGLNFAALFSGVNLASASAAAVTIELYVPFATVLSVIFLHEKVGLRRIFAIGLAIAGVLTLALGASTSGEVGPYFLIGVLLVATGAFCEATGAIFVKLTNGFTPIQTMAWISLIGALALWPLTFTLESGQGDAITDDNRLLFFSAVAYSVFLASIFAHTMYYWLLKQMPVSQAAMSTILATMVAVFFGITLLGEPFSPIMILGAAMVIGGVGVVILRTPQKQAINTPVSKTTIDG